VSFNIIRRIVGLKRMLDAGFSQLPSVFLCAFSVNLCVIPKRGEGKKE
jgi:hypothetical protein